MKFILNYLLGGYAFTLDQWSQWIMFNRNSRIRWVWSIIDCLWREELDFIVKLISNLENHWLKQLRCRMMFENYWILTVRICAEINNEVLWIYLAEIECEPPNNNLLKFQGKLTWNSQAHSLKNENILLRGTRLRNTQWAIGGKVVLERSIDHRLRIQWFVMLDEIQNSCKTVENPNSNEQKSIIGWIKSS